MELLLFFLIAGYGGAKLVERGAKSAGCAMRTQYQTRRDKWSASWSK